MIGSVQLLVQYETTTTFLINRQNCYTISLIQILLLKYLKVPGTFT